MRQQKRRVPVGTIGLEDAGCNLLGLSELPRLQRHCALLQRLTEEIVLPATHERNSRDAKDAIGFSPPLPTRPPKVCCKRICDANQRRKDRIRRDKRDADPV